MAIAEQLNISALDVDRLPPMWRQYALIRLETDRLHRERARKKIEKRRTANPATRSR